MSSPVTAARKRTRTAALAAALLIIGPVTETATAATPKEKALRRKINAYRAEHNRKSLKMQAKLVKFAHKQAKKMAADGRFEPASDHSSPAQLTNYAQEAKCSSLAEIIASTIGSAPDTLDELMRQWQGSKPHNTIMLQKKWKKIGTGVFTDDKGRLWAVALFCKPA
ncbi:MAG: CAP domain-containing protein [Actinomycetota bacterium]